MNERIKELVKQAGGHISMRNLASNPVQHRESVELWDDRIEKFAELLLTNAFTIINNAMIDEDMLSVDEVIVDRLNDAAGDICDAYGLNGPILT